MTLQFGSKPQILTMTLLRRLNRENFKIAINSSTDVKPIDGGYKYAQVLPDIELMISAPYNESNIVVKDLLKSIVAFARCNKKVGAEV